MNARRDANSIIHMYQWRNQKNQIKDEDQGYDT